MKRERKTVENRLQWNKRDCAVREREREKRKDFADLDRIKRECLAGEKETGR